MSFVFIILLFISSLFVFGAEGKEPEPKRIKGSPYFLTITGGLIQPTYNIYGDYYQQGWVPMTQFKYRRTITGKPVLDIAAWNDLDERKDQYQALSTLVKAVTISNTTVKLDDVPYVIFRKEEMIRMAERYAKYENNDIATSFTVTPKDRWWWRTYEKTYSFDAMSNTFMPREIVKVQVKLKKGRYKTRFILKKR
ncbi:hypothetical protein LZ30DRAFT_736646 [Colletotrichum cereale]|nr:hypothetical protein LZ30DRAFT_736646 [Colletotrichum cereale]